jgi:hypothetical protein
MRQLMQKQLDDVSRGSGFKQNGLFCRTLCLVQRLETIPRAFQLQKFTFVLKLRGKNIFRAAETVARREFKSVTLVLNTALRLFVWNRMFLQKLLIIPLV